MQRIEEGWRRGVATRTRAATMRRQAEQTRANVARALRQQGRLSNAQIRSYNESYGLIDLALDQVGVPHAHGNDALVAPTTNGEQDFRYGCQNDPIAIAMLGDRLEDALKRPRVATRCPISGTQLAAGKRS